MSKSEVFQSLIDKLQSQSGNNLIFGEPVEKGEKTVIPVSKVMSHNYLLFSVVSLLKKQEENNEDKEKDNMTVKPIGIIEVTKDETRFIPIDNSGVMLRAFFVGIFIGAFFLRRKRK